MELLRAAVPKLQRVAVIGVAGINNAQMPLAARAGQQLGLTLMPALIAQAAPLDAAFADAVRQKSSAVLLLPSPKVSRADMASLVGTHRLPVITPHPHLAHTGALMAYGPDIRDMWRRAALQLARILKGEPVATMPIERPDAALSQPWSFCPEQPTWAAPVAAGTGPCRRAGAQHRRA